MSTSVVSWAKVFIQIINSGENNIVYHIKITLHHTVAIITCQPIRRRHESVPTNHNRAARLVVMVIHLHQWTAEAVAGQLGHHLT